LNQHHCGELDRQLTANSRALQRFHRAEVPADEELSGASALTVPLLPK